MDENRNSQTQGTSNASGNLNNLRVVAVILEASSESEGTIPDTTALGGPTCATCGVRTVDPSLINFLGNYTGLHGSPNAGSINVSIANPSAVALTPPAFTNQININVSDVAPITVGIFGGPPSSSSSGTLPTLLPLDTQTSGITPLVLQIQQPGGTIAEEAAAQPRANDYLPTNSDTLVRCSICFRPANKNHPRVTTCGHVFCGSCLEQALSIRYNCPICGTGQEYRQTLPIFF